MQVTAKDIKARLSRDDIVSILSRYGYEISTRDYKFCLRDERTPSAFINQDGTIHDYGAKLHLDLYDVLQEFNNISFTEIHKMLKDYIGITQSDITPPIAPIAPKKDYVSTLSDERHQEINSTLNTYDNSREKYQTFNNADYRNEVLSISPLWVFKEATKEAISEFKSITTYDFHNKTLVIKIHDYQGKLISYKRRRYLSSKWITAKDTHPNKQCLMSVKSDKKHIYIVEGHHDYLTAILLGIDVIAIPTVTYKKFTDYEVSILKNRDVILIADYDVNNSRGVECMHNLGLQIDKVSNATKVFSLPKFLESENISFSGSKLDLSDVVELWSDGLEAFTNTLEYRADANIFYYGKEIF